MIKFQTETTDISRNIGIEMGKKQYGFTDIDRFDHRVDRNDRIFNFGGNGWYPAMDIFGVLVLGVVTAVGGGMMRDVILGKTPSAFVKPIYVEVAVISALAPFLLLSINKRLLHSKYQALYAGLMFLMDSVGLGIFTAVGVSTG